MPVPVTLVPFLLLHFLFSSFIPYFYYVPWFLLGTIALSAPQESGHNFAQVNRINLMDSFLDGNQEWRKKMFSIRVGDKVVLMGLAMLSHWVYDGEILLFHNLIT